MREFILSKEDLKNDEIWIVQLVYLSGLVETRLEARRMVSQGAITVNGQVFMDINRNIKAEDGMIIGAGKLSFVRLKLM